MSIAESKVTDQGRVSIPAKVREKLGLAPGTVVEWVEEKGKVYVRRAAGHSSQDIHDAIFSSSPETKSLPEMKQGIRNRTRRKHEGY